MSSSGDRTKQFQASDFAGDGKFHLLLAASGSVATIKIPNIIQALSSTKNLSIRLVLTESASHFLRGQSDEQPRLDEIKTLPLVDAIYLDEDEWEVPWTRGSPILHIELRRWADLLLIAPLSANTLAKLANGFSDNLLTSIVRAWQVETMISATGAVVLDRESKLQRKILVAPSMNTMMWMNPMTSKHLSEMHPQGLLYWMHVLTPVEKTLACGDTGNGAMHPWEMIVRELQKHICLRVVQ